MQKKIAIDIPQRKPHPGLITSNVEEHFEQPEMGMNAKEAFAKGEEDRKMKKGVWGKLMKLYPVGEKETV